MLRDLFGAIAAVLAVISAVPYLIDIFRGKTKPHLFTWTIWSVVMVVALTAQIAAGADAGAWATGAATATTVTIALLAITRGEKSRTRTDWLCLGGAAIAGVCWVVTDNPTLAVILVTLIDLFAYIPTMRKSWNKPGEETISQYALSNAKHFFSVVAVPKISVATVLYQSALFVMNCILISILVVRRRHFGQQITKDGHDVSIPT